MSPLHTARTSCLALSTTYDRNPSSVSKRSSSNFSCKQHGTLVFFLPLSFLVQILQLHQNLSSSNLGRLGCCVTCCTFLRTLLTSTRKTRFPVFGQNFRAGGCSTQRHLFLRGFSTLLDRFAPVLVALVTFILVW